MLGRRLGTAGRGRPQGGQVVESYAYDANGNRTSATRADCTTLNAAYDAQDRLKSFGSNTYSYSRNGDLTSVEDSSSGDTASLQYDALGDLKQVATEDGKQVSYLTDPLERRVGKKVDGQLVQGFLYGDDLGPEAELNSNGSVKARFVYGTSAVTPDYMVKAGTTYRIVSDERGSPRLVVNTETGEIAQELDYDSYGRIVRDTNPGFQPFGFEVGQAGIRVAGARGWFALLSSRARADGRYGLGRLLHLTADARGIVLGLLSDELRLLRLSGPAERLGAIERDHRGLAPELALFRQCDHLCKRLVGGLVFVPDREHQRLRVERGRLLERLLREKGQGFVCGVLCLLGPLLARGEKCFIAPKDPSVICFCVEREKGASGAQMIADAGCPSAPEQNAGAEHVGAGKP